MLIASLLMYASRIFIYIYMALRICNMLMALYNRTDDKRRVHSSGSPERTYSFVPIYFALAEQRIDNRRKKSLS